MDMHHPPVEGNFHNEHGNALKSAIIQAITNTWGTWTGVTL
jgi:hypothetical protein